MSKMFPVYLLIMVLVMMITANTFAQQSEEYNVAIYLYDGVELLDFSGPGEVFAATGGFNVYTVSTGGSKILSQGFVTVQPEFAIDTAPTPDIVVFPGGGTGPTSRNPAVLNWIKKLASRGTINMSVCTGANILAKAGLLDSLNVTTWYGFTDRLQEMLPNATVHEDTRFVDSGDILTTAGVSAGIDGALHMVSRIKGKDVARETAKYMEYDKWEPEDGMIDYENPVIAMIRDKGIDRALNSIEIDFSSGKPAFYEGEMRNLGFRYMNKEDWKGAEEVFELVVKYYPKSVRTYTNLGEVYENQGKYAPLSEEDFIEKLREGNIDEAISSFRASREQYPGWMMFSEEYLNYVGYQHLQKEKFNEAIRLFELNAEVYPESANVFDSLGEAYLKAGEKEQAEKNYRKALQIDPGMESSRKALSNLKKGMKR